MRRITSSKMGYADYTAKKDILNTLEDDIQNISYMSFLESSGKPTVYDFIPASAFSTR
jgi:hypothetical protein